MTKTCDTEAELDDKAEKANRFTECGYKRNTVDKSLVLEYKQSLSPWMQTVTPIKPKN